jgi:hypothetical protein
MYAEQGQLWIIEKYAQIFKIAPTFLLIPLTIVAINLLFRVEDRTKRILNIFSVIFTIIGSFIVVWMF